MIICRQMIRTIAFSWYSGISPFSLEGCWPWDSWGRGCEGEAGWVEIIAHGPGFPIVEMTAEPEERLVTFQYNLARMWPAGRGLQRTLDWQTKRSWVQIPSAPPSIALYSPWKIRHFPTNRQTEYLRQLVAILVILCDISVTWGEVLILTWHYSYTLLIILKY